jgi:hypothetical protein
MVISILIFGYGLRNIEAAFMQKTSMNKFQDWSYIWNGFWCIVITILTIGYGDFYPQTHLGRAIAVIACMRYELAIVLSKTKEDALNLFFLSIFFTLLI